VVIGVRAEHVRAEDAWAHVAGLTVGQDISDLGPCDSRIETL
jgi:2,4-diketo-3-deoxy-L-fuconate hydrolase